MGVADLFVGLVLQAGVVPHGARYGRRLRSENPEPVRAGAVGRAATIERDDDKNPVVALREIAEETISLPGLEQDLIKSLSRAPEPEPADEEVLDLIPTDQNIFGLQDISAEEESANMPVEDLSPEDLEAAIEAELGGRSRR